MRPPSPTDPTLETRPAPRKHRFPIRSFGPGAAADILGTVTPPEELQRIAEDDPASQTDEAKWDKHLLNTVTHWEGTDWRNDGSPITRDPTWGFYLFLTDYSPETRGKIPLALENLIRVQKRRLKVNTESANLYANEVYHRLRFAVVEDKDALEGASFDRVRECFRALVRSFELIVDDDNDFPLPARNTVCFALHGDKVDMLANFEFNDDDRREETNAHEKCKLPAVDIWWKRPEMTRSSYRGVRELEITMLAHSYAGLNDQTALQDVEQ